jgi:hypothetical protein
MLAQNRRLLVGDGDLHIHTGLDGDVGDLADLIGGGVQVNDALVDSHLEAIVGVGTFTIGSLAGHQAKDLGGHANGARHLEVLDKSLVLKLSTHLLDRSDVSGSQSDSDAMDGHFGIIGNFGLDRGSGHFNEEGRINLR